MRKICFLLAFAMFALIAKGQISHCLKLSVGEEKAFISKKNSENSKAYSDTIYYEDFSGGFPVGWTSVDNTGNGFDFIWSINGPTGAFTGNWPNPLDPLNSPTASNGFLMLPSDYYNTSSGGQMVSSPVEMDAYFQTTAYDFSAYSSVIIRFFVDFRLCCSPSSAIWMKISTDLINWSAPYQIKTTPNSIWVQEEKEFNISSIAAGESTVYFRFGQENSSHYFFMIDDIVFVEGAENDIQISKCFNNFFDQEGYYNQIPCSQVAAGIINWDCSAYNNGSSIAPNSAFIMEIEHSSHGVLFTDTSTYANIAIQEIDTLILSNSGDGFSPQFPGDYAMKYNLFCDSIDEDTLNNFSEYLFSVTNGLYARDNGDTMNLDKVSWQMWASGGVDGDRIGVSYKINDSTEIKKMSFYCHSETDAGVTVKGYLLKYNEIAGIWDVILNSNSYTITISDIDSWVDLMFILNGSSEFLAAGNYMIVIETYYNGLEFWIGEDITTQQISTVTRWWIPTDPTYYWFTNYHYTPMIRLHTIDTITPQISINSIQTNVSCYGGNDGSVSLSLSGGQSPYSFVWSNGNTTQSISNLIAGLYSVSITDSLGTIASESYTITQNDSITVYPIVIPVSTAGLSDGSVYIAVVGGTTPYSYLWNTGATIEEITGLTAGNYFVTITDFLGCSDIMSFLIDSTSGLSLPFEEDFEGGLIPSEWSQETNSNDGGWLIGDSTLLSSINFKIPDHTIFAATNDDACNCDKSNEFLKTPYLNFSNLSYIYTSFDYYYYGAGYAGTNETAYLKISLDSGLTWQQITQLPGIAFSPTWQSASIDLSAYAGNPHILLGWHYSDNGGWLYGLALDNIRVYGMYPFDAELISVQTQEYVTVNTSVDIEFTIKNTGYENISNLTLNYLINGQLYSDTVFALSIIPGSIENIVHPVQFSLQNSGVYQISAWLSFPNGFYDMNNFNDTVESQIQAVPYSSQRLVLLEHWTQASCSPCANQNPILYSLIKSPANINKIAHIAYHTWWPGVDPMYDFNDNFGQGDARQSYYGVNAVPNCIFEGNITDGLPNLITQQKIDEEYSKIGLASINGNIEYNPAYNELNADIIIKPFIDLIGSDFTAHCILIQDTTYSSAPGSNGETYFPDVMRYMFSGVNGETISGTLFGDSVSLSYNWIVPAEVHLNSSKVVVFIQRQSDNEIIMADQLSVDILQPQINLVDVEFNVSMAGVSDFNPTTDKVYISGEMFPHPSWYMPSSTTYQLIDNDGDEVYSLSLEIDSAQQIEYKYYINSGWSGGENISSNRQVYISGDTVLNDVWEWTNSSFAHVTFYVDVNEIADFNPLLDTFYICGEMSPYNLIQTPGTTADLLLSDSDSNGVYSVELVLSQGGILFAFFRGPSWNNAEPLPSFRTEYIVHDTIIYCIWGDLSSPIRNVTFNVNMNTKQNLDTILDKFFISGELPVLTDWEEPGTNPDLELYHQGNGFYTITTQLVSGSIQYKYFYDSGWNNGEWQGSPNRDLTIISDTVIHDLWGYQEIPLTIYDSITNVLCYGETSGAIILNVISDFEPVSFIWDNGQTNKDLMSIQAGDYIVSVSDSIGNSVTASFSIIQPDELLLSSDITPATNSEISDGSIINTVSGGVPPYSFEWNTGETTLSIESISIGDYTLTITDSNLCIVDTTLNVPLLNNVFETESLNEAILFQNTPNPFQNYTTINYYLPRSSEIELSVYNFLGERIKVLEKVRKSNGLHSVSFTTKNQSSGIYFYKLEIDGNEIVKRMELLK